MCLNKVTQSNKFNLSWETPSSNLVPRKGHDGFLFSPCQFTGKMELHLTHTMPCQVWMTVPKCTLFCVLQSTSHHIIPPHSHVIFSTKLFPSWDANGRWVLVLHSKILIQRVLYITLWQGMA